MRVLIVSLCSCRTNTNESEKKRGRETEKKPKFSHRKVTGDVSIQCNYYQRPTKPVGKTVDGVLVTIQPEKLEKHCIAFHVEYYPEEREKKELCDSDDFKKCNRYMMRHGRKPIEEK